MRKRTPFGSVLGAISNGRSYRDEDGSQGDVQHEQSSYGLSSRSAVIPYILRMTLNKLYYFYAPRRPDLALRLVLLYPGLPRAFIYLPVVVHLRHKLFLTKYSSVSMHMWIAY